MTEFIVRPVGHVESKLTDLDDAPRQGDEGGCEATIVFAPEVAPAIADFRVGNELILLSWLDRADRDVLAVHPRDNANHPLTGVFNTRSSHRPNPIGLHRVTVLACDGLRVRVGPLEAVDGTPILDVKGALGGKSDR